MLDDLELSLMAFPQSWTAATQTLAVNLLVLPIGNPLGAVGSLAKFAGTTLNLNLRLMQGEALPASGNPAALTLPFAAVPPPGAVALLQGLQARLPAGATITTGKVTAAKAPPATLRIKKALPPSYTQAIPFSRPLNPELFVVGDGYGCAVKAQDPGLTLPRPSPNIAWGQLISYILQQPALAQACGFVYQTAITIPPALLTDTSWISFAIDTSNAANPFVSDLANPDAIRSYAARLPALAADRKLFAAALFPIVAAPGANLATPDLEAQIYDDGFAQVTHCHQPPTIDTATGNTTGLAPGAEAGIQIGWDDEQVTVWLDRSVGLLRDRANNTTTNPESPLGVLGYRVDTRESGAVLWNALCAVTGTLPFSGAAATGIGNTPSGELFINPAPTRSNTAAAAADPGWMPLYFAAWRGASLVTADPTVTQLNPPAPAGTTPPPLSTLSGVPVPPPLYGHEYQFRVRLTDLTGGGPAVADAPLHPGLVPIATCPFRRFISPKSLEVTTSPAPPPLPAKPLASRTITKLVVARPFIGYPEAMFAGVAPTTFQGASLTSLIDVALASGRAIGVPDPDVDRFLVTVEAAIPDHDTGIAGSLPGELDGAKWRIIYSVTETFPAATDGTVTLSLSYVDTPDISAMTPPPDGATLLPIPTARDIRLRLTPLSAVKSNYYGTPTPPAGAITDFITRKEATSEADLFPFKPETQLSACWLQPGGNLPALLAQSFGLTQNGLTLGGSPGQRTVFAVSGALRASLAPDRSAVTLASSNELLDHWIVALSIDIARDWTWEGFAPQALSLTRDGTPIGNLTFPTVIGGSALGDLSHPADRSMTRLVFLDAISPDPSPGHYPREIKLRYVVTASFTSAPALYQSYTTLRLPITTRPAQTPRIVSTGIIESPYVPAADYSSTALRTRFLWIEFDAPIADGDDDAYFGRVLAYGPDPLLAIELEPDTAPVTAPEPPLGIDPEAVRVIFAGEDSDESGLDAMTPLIAAIPVAGIADGLHYLLPLPPGIAPDALDLFGFWTYEFRVGHSQIWSTAQGRFGRPLRVAGIQHPPPQLTCTTWRNDTGVTATAPYATTLLDGQPALNLRAGDPQTALWFMLYAQVTQTDGASQRNILLSRQCATLLPQTLNGKPTVTAHSQNREPRGTVTFTASAIAGVLSQLGLPANAPLSVLCVEILPGPLQSKQLAAAVAETEAVAERAAASATTSKEDPVGSQLGERRILRTSPLTPVPAIC
ncbi:hypothetical protein ACELLULO517_20790 [Acidisoma cellulosilytica]|uniref:Uncharacterized protein n=1 Tax=Acidisoma cellulosilyticum TaxID=2802395 RepID=A0A963Z4J3_9PROT|nr:hypothetical protein [Acidisoma cellulosilyticum]MCB8882694.1 hypothetical protein [Acidisoma cellulosilyticum]